MLYNYLGIFYFSLLLFFPLLPLICCCHLTFAQNQRFDMAINKCEKNEMKKPTIHPRKLKIIFNKSMTWHRLYTCIICVDSILRVQRQCTFKNIVTNKSIVLSRWAFSFYDYIAFSLMSSFPTESILSGRRNIEIVIFYYQKLLLEAFSSFFL